MAHELEYLDEALKEAEAAARWYAERSDTAAVGFSDEMDAAESAIARLPEAWPRFDSLPVGLIAAELVKTALEPAASSDRGPKLTPRRRGSALDIHHTSNGHAASLQLRALRVSVDRPSGPEIRAPRR